MDFGLSFNDGDEDDLTRVGEEVGTRFLRLPEHAFGERGSASDVTQLAGVFFFVVTGLEPRVLTDQTGLKPHQRPEARAALADLLTERQLRRIMSVFDKAFATELPARYPSGPDLIDDLEKALQTDSEGGDELDQVLGQVDEITRSLNTVALSARRETLRGIMRALQSIVESFASTQGLVRSQTGYKIQVAADEEWVENHLGVAVEGSQAAYTVYRIEARGPNEYVAFADGVEVWRGESADQPLTDAITMAAAKRFLTSQHD